MNHTFKSVFLIFTLLASSAAVADKGRRGKGRFKELIKELNLNDEQLQRIKEHRKSNKGKMKPLREEARTLREEMSRAFINGASDGEFKSLNSRLGDIRSKLNEARFSKMMFFKNVLTKEQRQKWQEKKKGWKKRRRKNKGSKD